MALTPGGKPEGLRSLPWKPEAHDRVGCGWRGRFISAMSPLTPGTLAHQKSLNDLPIRRVHACSPFPPPFWYALPRLYVRLESQPYLSKLAKVHEREITMSAPAAMSLGEKFFDELEHGRSGHDVAWLKQQEWRFRSLLMNNSCSLLDRIAVAIIYSLLGNREKSVDNYNVAFSQRGSMSHTILINLARLSIDLGFDDNARTILNAIISSKNVLNDIAYSRYIIQTALLAGDFTTLKELKDIFGERCKNVIIRDTLLAVDSLERAGLIKAFTYHQNILYNVITNKSCSSTILARRLDGETSLSIEYTLIANIEERINMENAIFDKMRGYFDSVNEEGFPLMPYLTVTLSEFVIEE